jgi:hypothetical protein
MAAPAVAFARVDPETLCLACLAIGDQSAGCPSCGFDPRRAALSPLHLPPRTILHGHYLLGRTLGQGGFGITYLGWDLNLDVPVAIKEFLPTDFASRASGYVHVTPYGADGQLNFESGLDAFESEARTLARCVHLDGVVDVWTYFRENGTGYIVMPYIQGQTFREYLKARATPLAFDEALAVMRPVLIALMEVHRIGLVHRDVSPDNIYVGAAGRVCLLDFGAARHAVRERSRSLSVQFKAGYTPEEQYQRHGKQGPWTDVYAAAATIYRAITGAVPPPSLDRRMHDGIQPPSALGASVPRDAEKALMRGLALDADQRYRTMADFLSALAPGADAPPASGVGHAAFGGPGDRGGTARRDRAAAAPGAGDMMSSFARAVFAAGAWCGSAIADVGRVVRYGLDGVLRRAGVGSGRGPGGAAASSGGARERHIREQLAALWPVTLVELLLRDPHLPAGPDHGPYDVYARDETRAVAFTAVLQNNFAGIHALRGALAVAFVPPGGEIAPAPPLSPSLTLDPGDFVDRVALDGRWPPGGEERSFLPGLWRLELWWDGRKIGERGFMISV